MYTLVFIWASLGKKGSPERIKISQLSIMAEVVVQKTVFNQEYNTLLDLSKQFLQGKILSAPVLLSLVAALAGELNQIQALKPAEKKELLCKVVESALENALTATDLSGVAMSPAVSEAEQVALRYVVKNVVPSSVDLLVAASTGSLNLKAVKASAWSFCQICVPVVAARVRGPAWAAAEAFVKKVQTGGSLVTAGADAAAEVAAKVVAEAPAVLKEAVVDDGPTVLASPGPREQVLTGIVLKIVTDDGPKVLTGASVQAVVTDAASAAAASAVPDWSAAAAAEQVATATAIPAPSPPPPAQNDLNLKI